MNERSVIEDLVGKTSDDILQVVQRNHEIVMVIRPLLFEAFFVLVLGRLNASMVKMLRQENKLQLLEAFQKELRRIADER